MPPLKTSFEAEVRSVIKLFDEEARPLLRQKTDASWRKYLAQLLVTGEQTYNLASHYQRPCRVDLRTAKVAFDLGAHFLTGGTKEYKEDSALPLSHLFLAFPKGAIASAAEFQAAQLVDTIVREETHFFPPKNQGIIDLDVHKQLYGAVRLCRAFALADGRPSYAKHFRVIPDPDSPKKLSGIVHFKSPAGECLVAGDTIIPADQIPAYIAAHPKATNALLGGPSAPVV